MIKFKILQFYSRIFFFKYQYFYGRVLRDSINSTDSVVILTMDENSRNTLHEYLQ